MTQYRNRKLLDLARDQACVMCGAEDGTVVAAHSNLGEHGKGKSLKAHDCCIAFLCYECHTELDQGKSMTREQRRDFFLTAMALTMIRLFQDGKVVVR